MAAEKGTYVVRIQYVFGFSLGLLEDENAYEDKSDRDKKGDEDKGDEDKVDKESNERGL
jgi:hypothetical protein